MLEIEARTEEDRLYKLRLSDLQTDLIKDGSRYIVDDYGHKFSQANLNQYSNIEANYTTNLELLGISEEDLKNICDDLFAVAPIKFKLR